MNKEVTGWISLHRKSIESTVFQNPVYWYVWTWCLLKANHKDSKFLFNSKEVIIKRGQFITGRTKALEEMPYLTAQRYRTAMGYLKSTSRITTEVTSRFTIVTVCKYDDYQNKNNEVNQQNDDQDNQLLTSSQPATNQLLTTNNNENNDNNGNKKSMSDVFNTDFIPGNIFDSLAHKLWIQCYNNRAAKNIKPTILEKAKRKVWANEMRLMIETDGRTEAEITEILSFLKTDDFWPNNIQSPDKLRKQFERLQMEARKTKNKFKENGVAETVEINPLTNESR